MLAYIIRRVAQSILVLLVVGLVAFSMFRFVGDPIDNMLGQERTQADIDRLRIELGLDQPFVVQYYKFLGGAVQGNFGVSYRQGRPVSADHQGTRARDVGIGCSIRVSCDLVGDRFGRLHSDQARRLGVECDHVCVVDWCQFADLSDRYPIDLLVFRGIGLAPQLWQRRGRGPWLVDNRIPDSQRVEGADFAVDHFGALSNDADNAACQIRDA